MDARFIVRLMTLFEFQVPLQSNDSCRLTSSSENPFFLGARTNDARLKTSGVQLRSPIVACLGGECNLRTRSLSDNGKQHVGQQVSLRHELSFMVLFRIAPSEMPLIVPDACH